MKRGLVNLHSHSEFSDGADSILKMANKAKELGHNALVVTDHGHGAGKAYWQGVAYVKAMKNRLPLPAIVGVEISSPFGHHHLFGRRAIKNLYGGKNETSKDI